MERVTKVFFDPLAATKSQIRAHLEGLPVGSAHPFRPEGILLRRSTLTSVEEIDISHHPDEFFLNAVDLGALGETLQGRMTMFQLYIGLFNDEFTIEQAPTSTFRVPVTDKIAILALSNVTPSYYDLCIADCQFNTSCYASRSTLPGLTHSGDIRAQGNLLQHITISERTLPDTPYAIFVSGYTYTKLTRYKETNPVVLVANHTDKVLYIVPVPLDAASIGDAVLCCPMVLKRDGDSLVVSILPTPTTDDKLMCSGNMLRSPSFKDAIERANFTVPSLSRAAVPQGPVAPNLSTAVEDSISLPEKVPGISMRRNVLLATQNVSIPSIIELDTTQIVRFDTGIDWMPEGQEVSMGKRSSEVLPCALGGILGGPMLLATGATPSNVPFSDEATLHAYYQQAESVVILVDDRMTDNARNVANSWRINALFILQVVRDRSPAAAEILPMLDSLNINAVTSMAGPSSLVLVQLYGKYYFYRGIANRLHLNTSGLVFGAEVTDIIMSVSVKSLLEPRSRRLINLAKANPIILPTSSRVILPQNLKDLFEGLHVNQIGNMKDDIAAVVPQLQALLSQKELQELSTTLISVLSSKVSNEMAPMRTAYMKFLTMEYQPAEPESVRQKNKMLGDLRKHSKKLQTGINYAIQALGNMTSSQTTSKRVHDLKRFVRQTAIKQNVEVVKSMKFSTLSDLLETKAEEEGVLLLNIDTAGYTQLLRNLDGKVAIEADPCCRLDSRVLHLEGFDAGIILEQSQMKHDGPPTSQLGPTHPTLALPYLTQGSGSGSMLTWVCWDEFVNLENPYCVRWMEKCNETHIAALRIMMRDTLSKAVISREHNLQPGDLRTGQLMSALLMAAMRKLAGMRTTAPSITVNPEDTITKLMRGLFGNLLTIAGSGVRPLSMVWQLLGKYPQLDVPSGHISWSWYETVISLYPYTGWSKSQINRNLETLLDKAIIRVITTNERVEGGLRSKMQELITSCKLRNIQLMHSRSIIYILARMITKDGDRKSIASRLLKVLPHRVEDQTQSYSRLYAYIEHLANGGQRRAEDDLIAAHVYTKRSAAFAKLKAKLATAYELHEKPKIKSLCQKLVDKHAKVATYWGVKPDSLKVQNMSTYKELLHSYHEDDADESIRVKNKDLFKRVLGDAERERVPWQIGKGEYGTIEPLDEAFVHEIMTGESIATVSPAKSITASMDKVEPEALIRFAKTTCAGFISAVEGALTGEDVCMILGIPASTMRTFVRSLNPDFGWEKLAANFKDVVSMLLSDRSNREGKKPTGQLLGIVTPNRVSLLAIQE